MDGYTKSFLKFLNSLGPPTYGPITIMGMIDNPNKLRWFEGEPVKTETELLKENIQKEWNW